MKKIVIILLFGLLKILSPPLGIADDQNEQIILETTLWNHPSPGYLFLSPLLGRYLAVYDNYGKMVYYRDFGALSSGFFDFKIHKNGKITAFSPEEGKFLILDQDFNIVDTVGAIGYSTDWHDIQFLSNGNVLVIGRDQRTIDMRQYIPNGHPSAQVLSFVLQEINLSTKQVVWQWSALDHLSVTDATEDIDVTSYSVNPFHINSIEELSDGNILVSWRHLDEITKINKQTGQIIWRLGGSKCRNNQFRFLNDTINNFFGFSHQHDARQLPNGNIILFDNGNLKNNAYSRAVEYEINEAQRTVRKVWEYSHPNGIISLAMGNVQVLPNNNVIIGWGGVDSEGGHNYLLTEVTRDGEILFEMTGTAGTYRVFRFIFKMDAVTRDVNTPNLYSFTNSEYNTNVALLIQNLTGPGTLTVEKHRYPPHNIPASGPCLYLPYRWLITKRGIQSFSGKIRIYLNGLSGYSNPNNLKIYHRLTEGYGSFTELPTVYNNQENYLEANLTNYGEFCIGTNSVNIPTLVYPQNNAVNVPINPNLTWRRSIANENYEIQISKNSNFDSLSYHFENYSDTSLRLAQLSYGQTYFWRVRTVTNNCISDWSNPSSFTTVLEPINLLQPLNDTTNFTLNPIFYWQQSTMADSYQFQLAKDTLFLTIVKDTVLSSTSFAISNLEYYTKYYWRVRGRRNSHYLGEWSKVWSFKTTLDTPKPLLPEDNSTNFPVDGTLLWSIAYGATRYAVMISESQQFLNNVIDTTDVLTNQLQVKNLKYFTKYYWKVKALAVDAKSNWSQVYSFKTQLATPQLLSPANCDSLVPINGVLRWEEVPYAQGYVVQITMDKNFDIGVSTYTIPKTTSFVYSDLAYWTKYYWRVKAIESKSESKWSEIYEFTTVPENYLSPPVLLSPQNNKINFKNGEFLVWLPDPKASNYNLQIARDLLFNSIVVDTIASDTSYRTHSLPYATRHYWRLRSINSDNTSGWSEVYSFVTALKTPDLYSPLNGAYVASQTIEFKWELTGKGLFYKFQIAYDKDFEFIIKEETIYDNNTLSLGSLPTETNLFWRVMAYSSNLESDWSEVRTLKIKQTNTNSVKLDNFSSFSIYPNPFTDYVVMEIQDNSTNYQIKIYDDLMREIASFDTRLSGNKIVWKSKNCKSSTFFVILSDGKISQAYKIICLP